MQVSVLGPLLVSVAGSPVQIGAAPKRRLALAALLARAGQPVPTDVLIEAIWGGRPPASARGNIQLYVHQLRRALGNRAITAAGDGYAIGLDDALDAARFRRLAADGGVALAAGDPGAAAVTLRSALDLWRGPAFIEFLDCPLVAEEAQRLEQLRLDVYERWAEALLFTGATAQLSTELAELCRLHPYRETMRAHLMRALYQTGRQDEALAVFEQARATLVAELGVEPGPSLLGLHEAILRGDDARVRLSDPGASASGSSTLAAPLPPRQLPAPPQVFTGRLGELATLDQVHDASAVVISAIDGMAGIGKTALAIHAAHRYTDRYPDGQLFIDLHGYTHGVAPVEPAEALDRMLRALGVPGTQIPAGLDDRAALYRTQLTERRMLIVLDNAASEAQVAPLLPGAPGCLVMVTSRRRLAGLDHTHAVSLDMLPAPDAVTLLTQTAGEDRLADQPSELMTEVVELCGRLPLAIRIAAARLRSQPTWHLSRLAERLRERQHRLSELEVGQRGVTAALDLSYQDLNPDQQRTYRLLGLHPGPDIDTYATAALLDSTLDHARRMLEQLLDAHLLLELEAGRHRFHDLTRAHAAHTAVRDGTESTRRLALDRLLDHYRHTAALAMDGAYPSEREHRPQVPPAHTPRPELPDAAAALGWLDAELPNLLATAEYAGEHGMPAHVLHLSTILHRHLRTRGRYDDAETLHHQALAVACATGDRAGQLDALNGLGHLGILRGRHKQAADYYQQALQIARATGHRSGELNALVGLGWSHWRHGRYEQAADHLTRALQIARSIGHRLGELEALRSLGEVHWAQGRHEQAADCYQRGLLIARATGHRLGELGVLIGLGEVDRRQGRYAQASGHYQRLLDLARESGDRNWQFEAWQGLGRLRHTTGHPDAAIAHHHQALALARELDQPLDEARARDGLAHAHRALNQHEQARRHWQHALDILGRLGVDHTDDSEATTEAIRTHLAGLDQRAHDRPAGV